MNERLIKGLIRIKLTTADTIIGQLLPELSGEIRSFGRIILEALNEGPRDMKGQDENKRETSGAISNIPVE